MTANVEHVKLLHSFISYAIKSLPWNPWNLSFHNVVFHAQWLISNQLAIWVGVSLYCTLELTPDLTSQHQSRIAELLQFNRLIVSSFWSHQCTMHCNAYRLAGGGLSHIFCFWQWVVSLITAVTCPGGGLSYNHDEAWLYSLFCWCVIILYGRLACV